MTSALEYLRKTQVFFLATMDGKGPRVRPLGFAMARNGALYFCTNKKKEMYRQMEAAPEVELSASGPDGTWIRITGRVAFDDSHEAKVQAMEAEPMLARMYAGGADNPIFTTFYLERGEAVLYSFSGAPQGIPLV